MATTKCCNLAKGHVTYGVASDDALFLFNVHLRSRGVQVRHAASDQTDGQKDIIRVGLSSKYSF